MSNDGDQQKLVYDLHVFCCINEREPGHPRSSCSARGAQNLHKYMKVRSKQLKIDRIRVNKAGCLDRCELGPVMVIYPEATWYRFDTEQDIDDILEQHIIGGNVVERLVLDPDQKTPDTVVEPRLRLRVDAAEVLTSQIRKFELVSETGGDLPEYTAGSHIDVFTGNGQRRSYSLAGDPAKRDRYIIAVLKEPNGRGGSAWIHEHLAVGDVVQVSPPKNNFSIDESATEHLLIAGGIGVTPLLSMAWVLKSQGAKASLHYSARSPETMAFANEVSEAVGDNVTFYHDGGDPAQGMDLEAILANPQDGACLYVCGPSGMIEAVQKVASYWPEDKVRCERFSAVQQTPSDEANQSFEVVLSRQGKTLTVPADKSILDVIKESGVEVDWSCEEGFCGTCHINLLGGRADHRDEFLGDVEREEHSAIMICSSRARPGETLILDS